MARDRSIKLIIQAQVDGAKRALQDTAKAAKGVGDAAEKASRASTTASERMVRSARDNSQAWSTAGTALTTFGAVGVAAMGGSAKAAIDWESAWAGVLKTVEASPAELGALEQGLRDLTGTMPAAHGEIAAVAEAAGQLGIETPNILGFTETMIQMGTSTSLSSEEAATALARFANIMGTSQSEFSNMGAAVVGLGNNFATTESEIVEMGLRLAGAGRQAGLTEGEVLGLATALSSVGIEAQAGGTAFSRILIDMGVAVDTQSEKLQTFAEVAGMSAAQFSQAWEEDAGSAIAAFVSGLGDIEASGESVQPILGDLGMTDIRVGDALRRASSAADLFTGAMAMGNEEYAKNNALTDEAAKRYETVGSQLAIMRNEIVDAAISFGEVFLPAISGAAGAVGEVADTLSSLPDPIKGTVGALGGLASVGALAAGGFMLVVPRAVETYDAFKRLQEISPRMTGALGKAGKAAGIAAGGFVALQVAMSFVEDSPAPGIEEMTGALLDLNAAQDASSLDDLFSDLARGQGDVSDFASAVERLVAPDFAGQIQDFGDNTLGKLFGVQGEAEAAASGVQAVGDALAAMVTGGDAERAAQIFDELMGSLEGTGVSTETVMGLMPSYAEALKGIDNEARLAAEGTEVLAEQVEDLNGQFVKIDPSIMQGKVAEIEAANRDILASFINLSNEIGNQEVSLDAWWASIEEQFTAQAAFIDNIAYLRGQGMNEAFVQGLIDQGPAGAMRTQQIVDAMTGSDAGNAEWLERGGEYAAALDQGVRDGLSETDPVVIDYELQQDAQETAARRAELESAFLRDGPVEVPVEADTAPARATIDDTLLWALELNGVVKFDADGSLAHVKLEEWNETARETTGMPILDANPERAQQQLDEYVGDAADTTGTAILDANGNPASAATDAWKWRADGTTGTATLDAWNGPAFSALNSFLNAIPNSVSVSIRAVPIVGGLFGRFPGFDTGGYTGTGGKYDPAGIVHADEFVHTKAHLSKPGMKGFHTDLWKSNDLDGAYRRHKLRGYADGGPVGTAPAMSAASSSVTAVLDAEDRALLRAVADRPVYASVNIGPRQSAQIVNAGNHANRKYGGGRP